MTRQITEMPRQDYSADTDYQPSRSVVDRLPFRAGMATLAATAIAGFAPEAGFSAEKYANTPVGVAREFATLFSQGKYIDACRLDHLHCIGSKRPIKNGEPWEGFTPVKVFQTKMPEPIHKKVPKALEIEVQTKSYAENGPWCMIAQKFDKKWELIWQGWGRPGETCANPNLGPWPK